MMHEDLAPVPASPAWLRYGVHSSLAVRDLDAALAFYEGTLGFNVLFRADDLTDEVARLTAHPGLTCRLAQIRREGEGTVELIEFGTDGARPASGDGRIPMGHLAFAVSNLDAALAAAHAAGAESCGEVVLFPEGRCAYCREPGGSVIEFEELAAEELR